MKLVYCKGKPILYIVDNFAIQLESHQIKYLNVNGVRYAVVIIAGEPIHVEPLETQ